MVFPHEGAHSMPGILVCLLIGMILVGHIPADAAELLPAERSIPEAIDFYLQQKLDLQGINPSPQASDSTVLRRTMLDLVGRIPTVSEAQAYAADTSASKRELLIDRLVKTPAYIRHNAREFDRLLAAENENAPSLEPYLLAAIGQRKSWDQIFTDVMGASADVNDQAARFVTGRLGDRDSLTRDVSSVFFGVNVSCCQCHDHPSVGYLSQDFYFGLKAFFHRSYEFHGRLMERSFAEPLRFKTKSGEEKSARWLLISGTEVQQPPSDVADMKARTDEEDKFIAKLRTEFGEKKVYPPTPEVIPRKIMVAKALESGENLWLARSLVNRLWYRVFGHGLVMRIDQMHPETPASHPDLLDWLARDLIDHQYDLHRLIRGLVQSQAYSRSSVWEAPESPPSELFAAARLRALTPMQYGLSLRLASSSPQFPSSLSPEQVDQQLIKLEEDAKKHFVPLIQEPIEGLQIGVNEAMRLSNDPELLKLLGEGTTDELMLSADKAERVTRLFWTVVSRPPKEDELQAVLEYLARSNVSPSPAAIEKTARIAAAKQRIPQLEQQLADAEIQAKRNGLQSLLLHSEAMLQIAAQQFLTKDESAALESLKELGLSPALYQNWRHFLGLHVEDAGDDARQILSNRFTAVLDEVGGNKQVVGLGSLGTPSVIVNLTNQKVQWFPPKRVCVHPSRTQAVIIGWQSPITGSISVHATAKDLDDGGGNGIAVSVQWIQKRDPTPLAAEPVMNGGSFRYQSQQTIDVQQGDILALTIDPLNSNHGFDTTEVNLSISEVGGKERRWDLNDDVVPSIRQNPHADRHGHDQVWHFALTGQPVTAVPVGSLIEEWNQVLRKTTVDRERLARLGQEIQSLLMQEQSAERKEADLKTRKLLTDLQSPLFAGIDSKPYVRNDDQDRLKQLRDSIHEARDRSQEKLSDDEQAEFERARQVWQQIVWSLLTSAEVRFNH